MSIAKKALAILSIAGVLISSANVYAAANVHAIKKVGTTVAERSVAVHGHGAYGRVTAEVTGGTGSGSGVLVQHKSFWPDTELRPIVNVYYNGGETNFQDFWLDSDKAYYVKAKGDKNLGVKVTLNSKL